MLHFFKKRSRTRAELKQLAGQLEQITKTLGRLEQKINLQKEQAEEAKQRKNDQGVQIEYLNVEQLENLTFQLDNLDIKELSGVLNIGNNIQSKDSPFEENEDFSPKQQKKPGRDDRASLPTMPVQNIFPTDKGYRFTNRD